MVPMGISVLRSQTCCASRRLFLLIIVLSSSEISSSSVPAWDFLLHKNAEFVGNTALISSPKNQMLDRARRSAEDHGIFPPTLVFSFKVRSDDVTLTLHKNVYVEDDPALYVIRNGKITLEKKNEDGHDYAYYQDKDSGAAVMVRRAENQMSYEVTGSYFHDGEEYSIQPMRNKDTDDVDHIISRLFSEANMQHDILDLGTDLLFAASTKEDVPDGHMPQNGSDNDVVNNVANNSTEQTNQFIERTSLLSPSTNEIKTNKSSEESKISREIQGLVDDVDTFDKETFNFGRKENNSSISGDVDVASIKTSDEIGGKSKLEQLDEDDTEEKEEESDNESKDVDENSEGSDDGYDNQDDESGDSKAKGREKRQTKSYVVELLIVIDYGVYDVWFQGVTNLEGEDRRKETLRRIKQFYSFVLNGIDLRYSSVQRLADFEVDVTWAGIIVFDNPDPTYWENTEKPPALPRDFVESSSALEAFRAWAEDQGAELPPSDHVMLFTGHNLTYGGSVSNAGLAYLGSACNPDYFFSIVEEYFEFRDVAIAAHELGHSLGSRHDMDGNTCLSFDRYIMTSRFKFPSRRKAQNPWLFSKCSVEYFKDFIEGLDRNDTNCFVIKDADLDNKAIQPFLVSLPGQVYVGDEFCRVGEGAESYICRDQHMTDYSSICYSGLYCFSPTQKQCIRKLPPNGFSCGNKKWCINGSCSTSQAAPATLSDDCPFGDSPGLIGGKTCAARMLTSRFNCYREEFKARCCASCRRYRRNLPGCEYGDLFELCKKEQCSNYDKEYALENCCDTCAELLFTIPTTIATTTTPYVAPTPKSEGKTTRKGDVTSQKGEGTDDSENSSTNQVDPPYGRKGTEDRTDGEGEDEKEEQNERKRKYKRKNFAGSDESEDSDESTRRRMTNQNSVRYRSRSENNRPSASNERLEQIKLLLDGMKQSRDDVRLQRMRLLMYILDRTRNEELSDLILEMTREGGLSNLDARQGGPGQKDGQVDENGWMDSLNDDDGNGSDNDNDSDSSNESR